MKIIALIFKSIIKEIIIIFIFIILVYTYIGPVKQTLKADATGYYDYLPSLFIYHDLLRKDNPLSKDSILYKRIDSLDFYNDYGDFKVNKYACGTAVLELPFFACTFLRTALEGNYNDGYQQPFQKAIFYAAIFYLFLSILFLKKILELYDIKRIVIIISQILLVFATSVTNYANYDAGFSHIYSLFAITAFIYFIKAFFKNTNKNHFILACIFFGLVVILRQINFLIIFLVPFLAGSVVSLKNGLVHLARNPKILIAGVIIIVGICFIQCLTWYLQTGKFFVYSYKGESFDVSRPHIFDILFSYKKGLFVYTPILFISLCSLIWLAYKRQYYLVITWFSFFILITYALSSWHSWYYGASYGMRAFIEFYPVFFLIFALMLNGINLAMKRAIIVLSFLTIMLNIIQTYQYKVFILSWDSMNKELYWKVFLKTSKNFKGLVSKKQINLNNYYSAANYSIGDIYTAKYSELAIYSISNKEIAGFEQVRIIQVLIDNEYNDQNDSRINLTIDDTISKCNYYNNNPYLIWFSDKKLNEWQSGIYNYEIQPFTDHKEKIITLLVKSGNQNNDLKNIRIKFLKSKPDQPG
jgi:hypothetical protein